MFFKISIFHESYVVDSIFWCLKAEIIGRGFDVS